VQHIAQGRIELVSGRGQRAAGDRQVRDRRIRHVGAAVFRKARMKQDLGILGARLPHQPHVHRLDALHGNEWRYLAALRRRAVGVGIGESFLCKAEAGHQ
jgi:hypothetical protein